METLIALEALVRLALLALIVLMILVLCLVALVEHPPRRVGFIVRRVSDRMHDRRVNRLIAQLNRRAVEQARERDAVRRLDAGT